MVTFVFLSQFLRYVCNLSKQSQFVFQITPGSKASAANLSPGDVIVAIDGLSTENMTHNDAQERIKAAAHQLCLRIERYVCTSACS